MVERVPSPRRRPSSSTTRPSSITSDGSGSFGPFIATRPSSASGSIRTSRRSARCSRRDVARRALVRLQGGLARIDRAVPRGRTPRSGAPRARRGARPSLELRRPTTGAGGGPCRSPESSRRAAERARPPAAGSRRAACRPARGGDLGLQAERRGGRAQLGRVEPCRRARGRRAGSRRGSRRGRDAGARAGSRTADRSAGRKHAKRYRNAR